MIALIRLPCLMEDEGRTFLLSTVNTWEEAAIFMDNYMSDDYFSLSDCRAISKDGCGPPTELSSRLPNLI